MAQGNAKKIGLDHGDLVGKADDDHSFYPKGVLGYAEVTANQTGITAETDLTGLSVTVDVGSGRRIRITGHLGQILCQGAGAWLLRAKESTTDLGRLGQDDAAIGERDVADGSAVITPSSGSHTYKLTLAAAGGGADFDALADSTRPNWILVEDIGPA